MVSFGIWPDRRVHCSLRPPIAMRKGTPPAEYTRLDVGATVAGYMLINAGCSIFQKLAIIALPVPMFLVLIQAATTLLLLLPFRSSIRLGSFADARKFLPISVCFMLMLTGSMLAYEYCTLGTVVVVGSVSPFLALAVERIYFVENQVNYSMHTLGAMALTSAGVVLYGVSKSELGGQLVGIFALISKILIAIVYQTRQRYLMVEDPVDISDTGMMVFNNVVTVLGCLLLMVPFGEYQHIHAVSNFGAGQLVTVLTSCVFCGLIGYFSFRTQRRVSATTFLITVNICKVFVVLFGWLELNESHNLMSALACALVLLGGTWYGWDRRHNAVAATGSGEKGVREFDDSFEDENDVLIVPSDAELEEDDVLCDDLDIGGARGADSGDEDGFAAIGMRKKRRNVGL